MEFIYRRSYRGPLQAVILDWAGTTVDYGSIAPVMAFVEVFKEHRVPITVEEARRPMGVPKKEHIRGITQIEEVAQRWQQIYGRRPNDEDVTAMFVEFVPKQVQVLIDYADPIPGALDTVEDLRARKLKIGSTTGYNRAMMDVLVPEARQRGYDPDSVVCATDVPAGRPEPWMALKSAMELRVYPMEAVVKVGDTLPDIAEGLNAGMWTIGVAKTGNAIGLNEAEINALEPQVLRAQLERAYQQMLEAGAHYVIDGIWDVPALLDDIQARLSRGEKP